MRNRRLSYLFLIILGALGLAYGLASASGHWGETAVSPPADQPTRIQPIRSDETGLQFTLYTSQLAASKSGAVQVDGLAAQIQEPGAPVLPYYTAFIALPPEATATVSVQAANVTTRLVEGVLSVPQPVNRVAGAVGFEGGTAVSSPNNQPPALVNAPDPVIYRRDALYPDAAFAISEPMYYRDLRLVELRLYPVRYNPVTGELRQTRQLNVSIQFEGARMSARYQVPSANDDYLRALAGSLLNYNQALDWRSLPPDLINAPAANFPTTAAETYKIEVNQDGIYEISGAELAAKGMVISGTNPATIEMMHRGQPVAYQFVGDGDAILESNEKIRFYGWAFDGPRTEKQFVTNNIFWLWAGGAATNILTTTNQTGGVVVTSTMTAVTREPENYYFSTWTNAWDTFPNEPDGWYWDFIEQTTAILTNTYQITLTHPITDGSVTYWIELLSRDYPTDPTNFTYQARGYMNDDPSYGEQSWQRIASVNISNTIPATAIRAGANDVHVAFSTVITASAGDPQIYLNRITVQYLRQLTADNDRLIFSDDTGGSRQFQIAGFTENNADNVLIWNTTVPTNPVQIEMTAGDIAGSGSYTYTVGSVDAAGAEFIAATTANLLSAVNISRYAPVSLDPPGGGADWVAISHADFITPANTLAAHRSGQSYGNLTTWVVDYEDVINQYGYGLPLPAAIRDYLAYALGNWSPAPGYVTLFGAATLNPRYLDCQHWTCPGGLGVWDKDQPTFVVTDLVYEDRFQGLIPTDHTMVLLSGDDLLPDMAIGRIPVSATIEAETAVAKIILYEQSQLDGADWQRNILFLADNADEGGDFYLENLVTASNYVPDTFAKIQRYLVTETVTETNALRDAMINDVNGPGVAVLNYRGHGSVTRWASPSIISSDSDSTDFWANYLKPTVILSADCLDGNFAFPGLAALSQTLLTLRSGTTPVGSAANWSSTGLGYTFEHSVLHRNFYDGLFTQNLLTIGDSVNYAKLIYHQGGYHTSEMYSFLLMGDPAMQMFALRNHIYLPGIQNQ